MIPQKNIILKEQKTSAFVAHDVHPHDQCLVCGHRARTWMQHSVVGHFLKCRCGLIFQDPREFVAEADAMGAATDDETFRKAFSESIDTSDDDGNMYAAHGIQHQNMVDGICDDLVAALTVHGKMDLTRPFSLLDIGCATGFLLDAVRRRFPWAEVAGVEPSPVSARKARELYGLEIHVGTMNTCQFESETFDVVSILGNLQLHENPFETLRRAAVAMKPAGLLVCQFKNPQCSARVLGRWASKLPVVRNAGPTRQVLERGFTCMRHSGNRKSLAAAISQTGLQVVHTETVAPRMARFSGMNQAHARGLNGRIWSLLNHLDKLMGQQAWIQFTCRKRPAVK